MVMALLAAALLGIGQWRTRFPRWTPWLMLGWTLWCTEALTWLVFRPEPPVDPPTAWEIRRTGVPALDALPVPVGHLPVDGRQIARTDDRVRVLFIGDSFTAGQGATLGHTTPDAVQRALDPSGATVEVLKQGRHVIHLAGRIHGDDERLVATAEGTFTTFSV